MRLRRILVAEGLVLANVDLEAAAAEWLKGLQRIPAPYSWMKFRRSEVSRYNVEYALHGNIPRRLLHEDEDDLYGEWEADPEKEAYEAWSNAMWPLEQKLSRKYPGVRFSTAKG